GYLGLVVLLVGTGQLTGSPRYYLSVVPLLLLGSRRVFGYLPGTLTLVGLALVPLNFYYFQQWPRWVVLNQPSQQAGTWLGGRSGMLYTDSPLVVYASRWPLTKLQGSRAWSGGPPGFLALVGDGRYRNLYPALGAPVPEAVQADWQDHWTVDYGAKPVKIYGVP
ncbi:hypothetical protein, partial [Candidatus Cyanaurora vandensis]